MKIKIITSIALLFMLFACSSKPKVLKDMDKLCNNTLKQLDTVSSFPSLRKVNWDFSVAMQELYPNLEIDSKDTEVKKYYEEVIELFSKVQLRFGELEKKYSPNFKNNNDNK